MSAVRTWQTRVSIPRCPFKSQSEPLLMPVCVNQCHIMGGGGGVADFFGL